MYQYSLGYIKVILHTYDKEMFGSMISFKKFFYEVPSINGFFIYYKI